VTGKENDDEEEEEEEGEGEGEGRTVHIGEEGGGGRGRRCRSFVFCFMRRGHAAWGWHAFDPNLLWRREGGREEGMGKVGGNEGLREEACN
jgi:hypothetical protein